MKQLFIRFEEIIRFTLIRNLVTTLAIDMINGFDTFLTKFADCYIIKIPHT